MKTFCPCPLKLHGIATFLDGKFAEAHIDIKIIVVDVNDNAPVFGDYEPANIKERSPVGEWRRSPPAFSHVCDVTLIFFFFHGSKVSATMFLLDEANAEFPSGHFEKQNICEESQISLCLQ